MKRYDIHVIHDGAGNMQQDGAGEYVLFDDAQAALAAKDLEIAALQEKNKKLSVFSEKSAILYKELMDTWKKQLERHQKFYVHIDEIEIIRAAKSGKKKT